MAFWQKSCVDRGYINSFLRMSLEIQVSHDHSDLSVTIAVLGREETKYACMSVSTSIGTQYTHVCKLNFESDIFR